MFVSMLGALLLTNSRTSWIIAFISFITFINILLIRKVGMKGIGIVLGVLILISIPFIREYSIKSSPFRARIKQYFHIIGGLWLNLLAPTLWQWSIIHIP